MREKKMMEQVGEIEGAEVRVKKREKKIHGGRATEWEKGRKREGVRERDREREREREGEIIRE